MLQSTFKKKRNPENGDLVVAQVTLSGVAKLTPAGLILKASQQNKGLVTRVPRMPKRVKDWKTRKTEMVEIIVVENN